MQPVTEPLALLQEAGWLVTDQGRDRRARIAEALEGGAEPEDLIRELHGYLVKLDDDYTKCAVRRIRRDIAHIRYMLIKDIEGTGWDEYDEYDKRREALEMQIQLGTAPEILIRGLVAYARLDPEDMHSYSTVKGDIIHIQSYVRHTQGRRIRAGMDMVDILKLVGWGPERTPEDRMQAITDAIGAGIPVAELQYELEKYQQAAREDGEALAVRATKLTRRMGAQEGK